MSMESDSKWHVSRAIDITNVLAVFSILCAGVVGYINFDRRISVLEVTQRHVIETADRDRAEMKETLSDIQESVDYIRKRLENGEKK